MWLVLLAVAHADPVEPPEPTCAEVAREDDGDTISRGRLRKGVPHGTWCRYAPYGRLIEEETFDRGVRDGPYWSWGAYEARVIGSYREGVPEGGWWTFDPVGALVEHGAYADGARVGAWIEHGATGAYLDGQRDGVWTLDEPRREVTYRAGVEHGVSREWDAAGVLVREETFADGALAGSVRYVDDGVETRGEVSGALRVGEWVVTDAQGVRERGVYVADRRHGLWETREDGARIERTWDHGVQEGPVRVWRGGVLVQEASYRGDRPHGTWTSFRDGVPERRLTYADGVLEGPYEAWDSDGDLVAVGHYEIGMRTGAWAESTVEGRWSGTYALGARTGVWRLEADGVVRREVAWVADRQDGLERTWSADGVLVAECWWREGLRHGLCATWRPDGTPESRVTWDRGKEHGPYTRWHDNGKVAVEGATVDGRADGACTQWHDNGRLAAKGTYAGGTPVGEWAWYHPSGAVERAGRYDADGLETGSWVERYPDGTRASQGDFVTGSRAGEWTFWYPSGQVERRGAYASGLRTGPWTFFHPSGVVAKEGVYVEGARNGRWTFRGRTGAISFEGDFVMGVLVGVDPWWPASGDPDPMPDPEDRVVGAAPGLKEARAR